jgi:hypothetical protein
MTGASFVSTGYATLFTLNGRVAGLHGVALLEHVAEQLLCWAGIAARPLPYRGEWRADVIAEVRVDGQRTDSSTARWRMRWSGEHGRNLANEARLATLGAEVEVAVLAPTAPARPQGGVRPPFVPQLLAGYECSQFGEELAAGPLAYDAASVPQLASKLVYPERKLPWVIISRRNAGGILLVDPHEVADELAGLANVAVLEGKQASLQLSAEIGQLFSCFDGALRVYWGSCDPASDDPYRHPLFLPWDVERDPGFARAEVLRLLCRDAMASLPASGPLWLAAGDRARAVPDLPAAASVPEAPVDEVSGLVARWQHLFGKPLAPVPAPLPREPAPEAVETGADEAGAPPPPAPAPVAQPPGEVPLAETLARLQDERDQWLDLLADQERRVSLLEARLGDMLARLDRAQLPPEMASGDAIRSVVDAVESAEREFPHLHFLPPAFRSARRSRYRHPDRVYRALAVMDAVAQQRATVDGPLGLRLEDIFAQYGLEYAAHLSQTAATLYGGDYRFSYRGERVLMESHIGLGNDFDPANCLRIHFAWSNEEKRWIVGHVGNHLRNTRSS